ncbi:MAG: hypothetical protein E6778_16525 [Niallia nealsonii]|nr:hypothetical protein [Niallia nealsonii]
MNEMEEKEQRRIAKKFKDIGKKIGVYRTPTNVKYPEEKEILEAQQRLRYSFESDVQFDFARNYLLGIDFSLTQIHSVTETNLYDDVLDGKKIHLKSYYYSVS